MTFTNSESTDLEPLTETAVSDENGVVSVELYPGSWIVSDESDENYVLWNEFDIDSDDLVLNLTYAVSVWLNGTVYSVTLEGQSLLNEGVFNSTTEMMDSNQSGLFDTASNVRVQARSGAITLESITSFDGNYSLRLPENLVFHITTEQFAGSNTYTGGMLVNNASQITDTNIYLMNTGFVSGTVYLRDSGENGTGVSWSSDIVGSQGNSN